MRLGLERRLEHSRTMTVVSPLIAIAITVLVGAIVFSARGLDPFHALYVYFVEPVMTLWSLEELVVKTAPLVLIGVGLAVCFRANLWNIGAEGQFTAGALAGAAIPILFPEWQSPAALPLMLAAGVLGGIAWAAVPAFLRNRFGVNEILTSLMLVYVAQYLLDWLVRGPWRDPDGYNFPESANFEGWHALPTFGDGRVHLGAVFAVVAVVVLFVFMSRTLKGFEIRVSGEAPRAGGFGGFSRPRTVWFCFALSGGLAGLAGLCEVTGPVGQLQPKHLSGVRVHRDHRRIPRAAESDRGPARGNRPRDQLSRRRSGADRARGLGQDRAGVPGPAPLSDPRVRHADPVPDPDRAARRRDRDRCMTRRLDSGPRTGSPRPAERAAPEPRQDLSGQPRVRGRERTRDRTRSGPHDRHRSGHPAAPRRDRGAGRGAFRPCSTSGSRG